MNFLISLQKDVALLSFIGPIEVLRQANVFKALYANFTPYAVSYTHLDVYKRQGMQSPRGMKTSIRPAVFAPTNPPGSPFWTK